MVGILQHKCRGSYPITVAALELGLELGVGLVCLQEPNRGTFNHRAYLLYWPGHGERDDYRVALAVRRDLLGQWVVEARTDLMRHPYRLVDDKTIRCRSIINNLSIISWHYGLYIDSVTKINLINYLLSLSSEIPLLCQFFKHSILSIFSADSCALSHKIVQRAPKKTRSGSSLIAKINRMSLAMYKSLGQCFCY